MPYFIVTVYETHAQRVLMKADDEEDAIEKVGDCKGLYEPTTECVETLSSEEWKAEEIAADDAATTEKMWTTSSCDECGEDSPHLKSCSLHPENCA
jgi:hypothetical protein